MKIIVYTVTDCQFSKQEKEYLTAKNLQFEERNLEVNKEWLTEMLEVGNNFAGTPVTKIEKDDGQTVVLKGFTKEEFDQALGFAPAPATDGQTPTPTETTPTPVQTDVVSAPAAAQTTPDVAVVPPVMPTQPVPTVDAAVDPQQAVNAVIADVAQTQPPAVAEPVVPPTVPPTPDVAVAPPVVPTQPTEANPQLNSLLQNLQAKADPVQAPAAVQSADQPATPAPTAGTPQIPDFH